MTLGSEQRGLRVLLTCAVLTQRLLLKVDSHSACKSVSYHQRRGSQVVGTHAVAQAAFKVSVAG